MDAIRIAKVENVILDRSTVASSSSKPNEERLQGALHLTAHHLIFTGEGEDELWIPYPLISLANRLPQTLLGISPLLIRTRTFESYTFSFRKDQDAEDVFVSVKDLTVAKSVEQLYAFYYETTTQDWLYQPRDEFARMGLGSRTKAWRFTDVNKDYEFCSTYPSKLVVPAKISDAVLLYAAKYRSKARIPALTYLHWANHASITRSSQPMVGLKNSRSAQDEKLIDSIFHTHLAPDTSYSPVTALYGATATNLIIDARPTTNAMANVAKGAGTENMENYRGAKKAYLGIENIHVMRDSLNRVVEALEPSVDRAALRRSGWLKHISTLLDGALIIIKNIHINSSHVLIHCSDGWDRTAQLAGLAEICLDPYYRTFAGFRVLVEKDWLSFGHKFLDRCGHLSSDKFFTVTEGEDEELEGGAGAQKAAQNFFASVQKQFASNAHVKETSPVFHQYLDCIRQLQRQFPDRFEFNQAYLVQLHYHLYSCQYGTFLFNNERERRAVGERTHSIWEDLQGDFKNLQYDASKDQGDEKVLLPNPKDVQFWHELFKREDDEMNALAARQADARGVDVVGPVEGSADDPLVPTTPSKRAVHPSGAASPGKAWGWSALSVIQGAARDLKDFGADALQQAQAGSSRGESRPAPTLPPPMRQMRMPSEMNPWGDVETAESAPAPAPARIQVDKPPLTSWPTERLSAAPSPALPAVDPYANEWTTVGAPSPPLPPSSTAPTPSVPVPARPSSPRTLSKSLADLTLQSGAKPAERGAEPETDKATFEAAMGGSTRAWDPLGVL